METMNTMMSIVRGTVIANAPPASLRDERKSVLACILWIVPILALAGCGHSQAAAKLPAPEAIVASPIKQDVAIESEWVATLDGYVNAEIRPQVSGYIISQDYKEGTPWSAKDKCYSKLIQGPSRQCSTAPRANSLRRKRS